MFSALVEAKARACDEVLHRSRYKDLAGGGSRGDARSDMDRDALHIPLSDLDLAGVEAATDFNIERADSLSDRASAANRARRPVESGEQPVSQRFDLAAAV